MVPVRYLILTALLFCLFSTKGQNKQGIPSDEIIVTNDSISSFNCLTVYVIPSKVKYDWSSPHSLYKSFVKNYTRNMFSKRNYMLGHAFIDLRSAGSGERIMTGMRSGSRDEQKNLIYKEHYGLSILGCDLSGRLETESELEEKLDKFSRKGQLAYMMFLLSDAATQRLSEFFQQYKSAHECDTCPEIRYGGAFYPRYYGEGAGCSAFVISFMELAGLLADEFNHWLISIDIPMSLIGGPYNNDNEVRLKDIRKRESWADTASISKDQYEHLEMFDPTLMYEWISDNHQSGKTSEGLELIPVALQQAKGIMVDYRRHPLPDETELFKDRETPSLFIDYYKKNKR